MPTWKYHVVLLVNWLVVAVAAIMAGWMFFH
jgi:hypothetical protein